MNPVYVFLFPVLWFTWAAYWFVMSRTVKRTVKREPLASRLTHVVPLIVAAWLLWEPMPRYVAWLNDRLWPQSAVPFWIGAAITLSGFFVAVWARVTLGRNWSGIVTVKENHELVTAGPYGFVRHPIYTGLLLAFIGSAVAVGEWRGVLAVLIVWASFEWKLRLEERWMTECFGARYDAYRQRVPALVPFVR